MSTCENLATCVYASVWIALILLFIIPFEIWMTIQLYRYRYHPGIQTRYPNVIIGSAIFAMIQSLICEQFYYLESGISISILNTPHVQYITHIIFPPLLLSMIVVVVFRVYLIHYDTNWAVSQSTRDWQSLLRDTVHANDFYSRYKSTFGNAKYVYKYFLCYIIICNIIQMTLSVLEHPKLLHLSHNVSKIFYVLCLSIVVIFATCLFVKTPKSGDIYYVRREFKYFVYLFSSCLGLYVTMMLFKSDETSIYNQISISAITIANFGTVFISEYIILNKIKSNDDSEFDYSSSKWNLKAKIPRRMRTRLRTMSSVQRDGIKTSKLFNVLVASPIGINFFVKHIRSEWCVENLLCFIELTQWIYLSTNKELADYNLKPLYRLEFVLSSIIPESSANHQLINEESETKTQWKWQEAIKSIYKKYIHTSAEYQVNLPYHLQMEFSNLIDLLKTRQEIMNRKYTLKHQISKRKKILFWSKNSNKSSRRQLEIIKILTNDKLIDTIHENDKIDPKSLSKNINTSNNNNISLEMGAFPKHLLMLPSHSQNVSIPNTLNENKVSYNNNDIETKINEHHDINMNGHELVIDDEYKLYKPSSNGNTITCTHSPEYSITVNDKTNEVNMSKHSLSLIDNSKIEKRWTIKNGLRKAIDHISADNEENSINNSYLKELEEIENAKLLNLNHFVSMSCQVIHVCLQLNYQSVIRFKKSKHYTQFMETCNVDNLVARYGNKGAYM